MPTIYCSADCRRLLQVQSQEMHLVVATTPVDLTSLWYRKQRNLYKETKANKYGLRVRLTKHVR